MTLAPKPSLICQICLQSEPDSKPPCIKTGDDGDCGLLCFHRHCLHMTWAMQSAPRCPHCNVCLSPSLLHSHHWGMHPHNDMGEPKDNIMMNTQIKLGQHVIEAHLNQWVPHMRPPIHTVHERPWLHDPSLLWSPADDKHLINTPPTSTTPTTHHNNHIAGIDNDNTAAMKMMSLITLTPSSLSALADWGFWVRKPQFISATQHRPPMNSEQCSIVLDAWSNTIIQGMEMVVGKIPVMEKNKKQKQQAPPRRGRPRRAFVSAPSSPHVTCVRARDSSSWFFALHDPQTQSRLLVSLLRTATIDSRGTFLEDGFVLSAERRRTCLPRRKKMRSHHTI